MKILKRIWSVTAVAFFVLVVAFATFALIYYTSESDHVFSIAFHLVSFVLLAFLTVDTLAVFIILPFIMLGYRTVNLIRWAIARVWANKLID